MIFQAGFTFGDTIRFLQETGVYEYFLPFLLIFAIIFAILEKIQLFGEGKTNINVVIAVVVGLLLIVQQGIVAIINNFLPRVSLIMVVILMGLLVISMLAGKKFTGLTGGVFSVAVILVIIALIIALISPTTFGFTWLSPYERDTLLRIAIIVGLFLLVIGLVTKKPAEGVEKPGMGRFFEALEKGFKGE